MLIKGENLNYQQRQQVLNAFGYRWTKDNQQRSHFWRNIQGAPTIPLISDAQWLKEHAFHFLKDGSRLSITHRHAEPVYMAHA
jgi:hypothetical protein